MEQENGAVQAVTTVTDTQNTTTGVSTSTEQLTASNDEIKKISKRKNRKKRLCFIIGIPCGFVIAILSTNLWQYYSLINERIQASKSSISENQESGLYKMNGRTTLTIGSKTITNYNFFKLDDDNAGYYDYSEEKSLTLSSAEYKRLDDLYSLSNYIVFDLTFSNGKLENIKILDKESKEDLGTPDNINWELLIGEDNLKYLSNYTAGQEIELDEDEGIYNNTNKDCTLIIIDTRGNEEEKKLGKGKVYVNDDFLNITIKIK